MDRALAVVDSSEATSDVIREAGELAAGVDASVVVLSALTRDEYENDAAVLSTIESVEGSSYDKDPRRIARATAEQYAEDHLSDIDVAYETMGVVVDGDDRPETIIETADAEGCDYIFLVGKRRSPTGKALFGDTAQGVILNFDGHVVITTE